MYKRLAKHLNKTRKSLYEVCEELNIDYEQVCMWTLDEHVQQCAHCDIWTVQPVQDLDNNPICKVCLSISGL